MSAARQLRPGLVIAINHEPLSFLRRAGHADVGEEKVFQEDHGEAAIARLAAAGCDMVRMHYYKGFGSEAERDEMQLAREYVRACHERGLMVQLYVQVGTLQYETLLAERPDMEEWAQVDDAGRPITLIYGHQTFRWYPCFNREGYWTYLEGIIRTAVEDFGADALGFDNISTAEEPVVCHCTSCRTAFRAWLKRRYPTDTAAGRDAARERFGHAVFDHIRPPVWNYFNHPLNLTEIRDPVMQEWVLFRCESLHRILSRLYRFAKGLNPDVLLELNTYKQSGASTPFIHGIYVPDLADSLDVFWNECDPPPAFTADGRLLHKVRGYKMASAMGKRVYTNHPGGPGTRHKLLAYAECMAFNGGLVGGVGSAASIYQGAETEFQPLREFARAHAELFDSSPCATVALLESKPSLAFSTYGAHLANLTIHQALLRAHVPYELIFDCDQLPRYRTLVLSGAPCLSAADIERVVSFVEGGGGLLVTGDAGENDAWYRKWRAGALTARLGAPDVSPGAARWTKGRGRVAYLPVLTPGKVFDPAALAVRPFEVNQPVLDLTYWGGPRDLALFAGSLRWAANGTLAAEVDAAENVVVDVQRLHGGGFVLHVLNYRCDRAADHIRVRFPESGGIRGSHLRLVDPETGAESVRRVTASRAFALPPVRTYLMAVLTET